jgi:glycosyltransferase involved in cell wall biosynthesis
MRILIVSNLYPPFFMGGYELGCQDVVDGLRKRGHAVTVFTSTYGVDKAVQDGPVYRIFSPRYPLRQYKMWKPLYFIPLLLAELTDWRQFLHFYKKVTPDIIYVWNGLGLSYSLLLRIQNLGVPVAFYIFEHWLTKLHEKVTHEGFSLYHEPWIGFWMKRETNALMKALKKILGMLLSRFGVTVRFRPFPLHHVHYASNMLKEDALKAGLPVDTARVIYYGLNTQEGPFSALAQEPPRGGNALPTPLKLLYVGNLLRSKGPHTLLQACGLLDARGIDFHLTIVGKKLDEPYYDELLKITSDLQLGSRIRIELNLGRNALISLYKDHHILIIPSIWREPLGMVFLEGMIAGIPVIHTGVGGSRELVQDGENCLLFQPGNHETLARQIERLAKDRDLYARLSAAGKQTVMERYTLAKMLDEIEEDLSGLVNNGIATRCLS